MAGGVAAALFALAAHRHHALDRGGATAATLVGAAAVGASWAWGVLLIFFFLTCTLLSRWGAVRKARRTVSVLEGHTTRDASQVLANGGLFAVCALGWSATSHDLLLAAGAGALGAAMADTWATEIGTLVGGTPRSLRGWQPVPPGTSGGITAAGTLGLIAGALAFGAAAAVLGWPMYAAGAATLGAMLGAMADSWMGATVQLRRQCERCGAGTERLVHDCGGSTAVAGGFRWLNNDGVNFAATAVGALGAGTLAQLLRAP